MNLTEEECRRLNKQVEVMRAELKNLRNENRSLQMTLKKEVSAIKSLITQAGSKEVPQSKSKAERVPEKEQHTSFTFRPIGHMETWFKTKNGTPRQSSVCSSATGILRLVRSDNNLQFALQDLSSFSHVWLIFVFDRNNCQEFRSAKVAPPRAAGHRVGVFATRSPHRPNPVGLTLARVEAVDGDTLRLSGVDLLDGTPIIDIKPYIPLYDSPKDSSPGSQHQTEARQDGVRVADWVHGPTLKVAFTERAVADLRQFRIGSSTHRLEYLKDWTELRQAIVDILQADPRSVYRKTKCSDKLYFVTVDCAHCTVWFEDDEQLAEVLRVKAVTATSPESTEIQ